MKAFLAFIAGLMFGIFLTSSPSEPEKPEQFTGTKTAAVEVSKEKQELHLKYCLKQANNIEDFTACYNVGYQGGK